MSKFAELLKQSYLPLGIVIEQEEIPATEESQLEINPEATEASELPILSNDDVRRLATALQVFYSKENPELSTSVIDQIRSIGPVSDDASAKAVVTTLADLLSPTSVDKNPKEIPNSDFGK